MRALKVLLATAVTLGRLIAFRTLPAPEVIVVPVGVIDKPLTVVAEADVALALVKLRLARLELLVLSAASETLRIGPAVAELVSVSPAKVGVEEVAIS